MTKGQKRAAVFCILKYEDKYLLLQRNKQPNQGKFVPVGGKIDPYESALDAVVRETMEETGIHIKSPTFCGVLAETSPTDYNWISFIYTVDITYIEPPYCDEGTLHWIEETELADLDTPPTDWHIYQYIKNNKPFVFSAIYDTNLAMLEMVDELEGTKLL